MSRLLEVHERVKGESPKAKSLELAKAILKIIKTDPVFETRNLSIKSLPRRLSDAKAWRLLKTLGK